MAAPEKNELTESDLFSALGITVGEAKASSKPKAASVSLLVEEEPAPKKPAPKKAVPEKPVSKKPAQEKPASEKPVSEKAVPKKPAPKKAAAKAVPGAPSQRKRNPQEARRKPDPDREAERAAQLREKAIRSRQWKEELKRKRLEQEMMQASPSQAAAKGAGSGEEVITLEAEKKESALLEDTTAREIRESNMRSRYPSYVEQKRDIPFNNPWVASTTQTAEHMVSHSSQTSHASKEAQPFRTSQSSQADIAGPHGYRPSQPSRATKTEPLFAALAQASNSAQAPNSAQTPNTAQAPKSSQSSRTAANEAHHPRGGAFAGFETQAHASFGAQTPTVPQETNSSVDSIAASIRKASSAIDAGPVRVRSRDASSQDDAAASMADEKASNARQSSQSNQSSQPNQLQAFDARAQYYPDMQQQNAQGQFRDPRYQQILMQQYYDQMYDYSDDFEGDTSSSGTSPLGIVLIVLAVLCVLVAASLLTGLWDISNLR